MSGINLSELIKGLMVIVAIALSLGKLPELKQWAIKEAFGNRARLHRAYQIRFHQSKSASTRSQGSGRNIEEIKRR